MRVLKYTWIVFGIICSTRFASALEVEHRQWQGYNFTIIKVQDISGLELKLYNEHKQPYLTFDAVQTEETKCPISFAMNAGMFHVDFSPVGLYVENKRTEQQLNKAQEGHGNFLIQPNGVVYWNKTQANIVTTTEYQKLKPNPLYATQSGPMLVIDGKINSHFIEGSDSKKIRNGVGLHQGQLWFAIVEQPINFYDFAQFFHIQLKIKHALYLDGGSVPSLYLPKLNRIKQRRLLGPMFVWKNLPHCA